MKKIVLLPLLFILASCTHGNCRAQKMAEKHSQKPEVTMDKAAAATERIKVYKPDGSLQCGQGKAIPVKDMEKELGGIKVYSSSNQNDGKMRIQLCGSPTGNSNVYEIDRKDLDAALKLGFKEWLAE